MAFYLTIKFTTSPKTPLYISRPSVVMFENNKRKILLRSEDPKVDLNQANTLIVESYGYESFEEAKGDIRNLQDYITVVFARLRMAAIYNSPLDNFKIFEDGRPITIVKLLESKIPITTEEKLTRVSANIFYKDTTRSEYDRIMFELFSAATLSDHNETRFVIFVMAIETLLDHKKGSSRLQAHVDKLIRITESEYAKSENEEEKEKEEEKKEEKKSLINGLGYLTQESIGAAGKRLMNELLPNKTYPVVLKAKEAGIPGEKITYNSGNLFKTCYNIRSRLMHSKVKKGKKGVTEQMNDLKDEVAAHVTALGEMVADLISYPFVDVT